MIPALFITTLFLILGHVAVIIRVIRLSEHGRAMEAPKTGQIKPNTGFIPSPPVRVVDAEELMCHACGRLLRRGSPYPYPCPCRTARRSRYAL